MKKQLLIYLFALAFIYSAKAQDYSGYTKCLEQDSLALVAFYNATDGPNWTCNQDGFSIDKLSDDVLEYYSNWYPKAGMGKWLQGPVKDWFGILMEKQQVGNTADSVWRVIHLRATISRRSAGDNNLKGYVPREVGLLTALKWFKVNGNVGLKNSEIPDEVYQPTLEALDIESVYFRGIISDAIKQCQELDYCNLRYNYLDSIPVFDFWTPEQIMAKYGPGGQTIYIYDNQIPFSAFEPSVEYFQTFSNPGDVQYEARKNTNVGREKEIIVKSGDKVVLKTDVGGKQGEYTWLKRGLNTYKKGAEYTINSVTEKDTGEYKVDFKNELVRMNDLNSDYTSMYSKPMYVRYAPVSPGLRYNETSYSGSDVFLTFSKPMAAPTSTQKDDFTFTSNGKNIQVASISREGRLNDIYHFKLSTPLLVNEKVTVSYNNGTVKCSNGGALVNLNQVEILNKTRVAPVPVSAITRKDGNGIFVTFDHYIDSKTLKASDFTIDGSTTSVQTIILQPGEVDKWISTTIELVLNESISTTDKVTVSYTSGQLTGLYGGTVVSFGPIDVTNVVEENKQDITITVEDGTGLLQNIAIGGNMKSLPFMLFDDGTNGDATANDHIWSKTVSLSPGSYTWTVFSRSIINSYDTISSTGDNGQIILEITPVVIYMDSLISSETVLSIESSASGYSGDTFFGFRNKKVTFILDLDNYLATNSPDVIEPYLMGISDDWSEGILMTNYNSSTSSHAYIAQAGGYNIGELINFNFRVGDDWENNSPQKRMHTIAGNDTIYAVFGAIPTDVLINKMEFRIYPNPAKDKLNVDYPSVNSIKTMAIYDLSSRIVETIRDANSIDISKLKQGLYLLKIIDNENQIHNLKFIKNN